MFALYPDGNNNGGGPGSASGAVQQKVIFFGQLFVYFGLIHAASYAFGGGSSDNKVIEK